MAVHGSVGLFDSNQEDWTSYVERLEAYFIANDVDDGVKKRSIFLSNCSPQIYQVVKSIIAPHKPTEKSFDELVEALRGHWQPKPSPIVQRLNFHSRNQKENETIAEFVAGLRKLSEHCNFKELEDMLRDRLVCGVRDIRVQKRLLADPELKFKNAFEIAQAMETAERNVKDLQLGTHQTYRLEKRPSINRGAEPNKTVDKSCYRCGGFKHIATECRFECRNCGKIGHIAKVCHSKSRAPTRPSQPTKSRSMKTPIRKTHQVRAGSTDEEPEYALYSLRNGGRKAYSATPNLNGADLEMEIDTGASLSLISEKTYHQLWKKETAPPLQHTEINLRTYTGEKLEIAGTINVTVKINGQTAELNLVVVKGGGPSLLGVDWLEKLKLDWSRVHQVSTETELQKLLTKHSALFKEELGQVKGIPAKLHLKPGAQPKFCRVRNVPFALRGKVERELERLEEAGVIEPVPHSEWATPIVPIVKRNGDIRICGDYKVTLNTSIIKVDSYPLTLSERSRINSQNRQYSLHLIQTKI